MAKKKTGETNSDEKQPAVKEEENEPRLLRRLLDQGLDTLLSSSEDGGRALYSPLALPKELISSLIGQVDRGKSEIVALFGREFKRFLEATDISEELSKALSQLSVEIKAEIKFKRNGDEVETKLTTRKRSKSKRKDK